MCSSPGPLPSVLTFRPSSAQTRALIIRSGARGELQLRCSETLPISQMTGAEEEQMVLPSRAGRDCSLQLIKPLIFPMLHTRVRKLLLPETLSGAMTDLPADVGANSDTLSFCSDSSFGGNPAASLASAEGSGQRSPGNDQPGPPPPLPPPFTSSMRLIVNRS